MKVFTIQGPSTKRVLFVDDDEMLKWDVIKISDYQKPAEPMKIINEENRKTAQRQLDREAQFILNQINTSQEVELERDELLSIKIYGWELYRVFRDEQKNILKMVFTKDGVFMELLNQNQLDKLKR